MSFRRAVSDLVRSICCRWLFSGCCEFSINIFRRLVCWLCFSPPFLFVLFAHFVILFFCYFVAGVFVPSTSAVLLRFFLLSFARSRFRLARGIRGGIWLFLVPPDSSPFTSVSAVDLHVHGAILICPAVVYIVVLCAGAAATTLLLMLLVLPCCCACSQLVTGAGGEPWRPVCWIPWSSISSCTKR